MLGYSYKTLGSAEAAIDYAMALRDRHSHLRLWYMGHETIDEFDDWRSFAAIFAEFDEDWEIVEHVAENDPVVRTAAARKVL
jgi:hypothetical protein